MANGCSNRNAESPSISATSSFKDVVQLRNRIKRRARRVAKKYDLVTDEGMLIKGIIENVDPMRDRRTPAVRVRCPAGDDGHRTRTEEARGRPLDT